MSCIQSTNTGTRTRVRVIHVYVHVSCSRVDVCIGMTVYRARVHVYTRVLVPVACYCNTGTGTSTLSFLLLGLSHGIGTGTLLSLCTQGCIILCTQGCIIFYTPLVYLIVYIHTRVPVRTRVHVYCTRPWHDIPVHDIASGRCLPACLHAIAILQYGCLGWTRWTVCICTGTPSPHSSSMLSIFNTCMPYIPVHTYILQYEYSVHVYNRVWIRHTRVACYRSWYR